MACCRQQWTLGSTRGRGAAAGIRGVPSLGSSAERVALALRLVRANLGRGRDLRDSPHHEQLGGPDGWFWGTLFPEEAHPPSRQRA